MNRVEHREQMMAKLREAMDNSGKVEPRQPTAEELAGADEVNEFVAQFFGY